MIALECVSKSFANTSRPAVQALSLQIEAKSLHVLLGESGSGKTTVLKMINRLVEPTSGSVFVDGDDIATIDPIALRRRIGYVFQGIGLFPHMTVAENIAVVPRLLGWSTQSIRERVDELLELMSLLPDEYRERYPRALSGGQQQRVGVARALAARPNILLMDEPFGALDPITRDELQRELKTLQQTLGLTVVLVTHDVNEALMLADRIAVMKDGTLLGHDCPERLIADPRDEYIRSLIEMPKGQANRLAEIWARANPGSLL